MAKNTDIEKQLDYVIKFIGGELTPRQRVRLYEKMRTVDKIAKNMLSDGETAFIGDAFGRVREQYSTDIDLDYKPRVKAGRLANGAERDHGTIIHAVGTHGALCGTEPGMRSGGWVKPYPQGDDALVNCDRCMKTIAQLLGVKAAELADRQEA